MLHSKQRTIWPDIAYLVIDIVINFWELKENISFWYCHIVSYDRDFINLCKWDNLSIYFSMLYVRNLFLRDKSNNSIAISMKNDFNQFYLYISKEFWKIMAIWIRWLKNTSNIYDVILIFCLKVCFICKLFHWRKNSFVWKPF